MKSRLAVTLFAVLAVAGCSSSSSGGQTSPPPTIPVTTTTPSVSPSASPTSSPSPTPTPTFSTTVKATHTCSTNQLSLSLGQGQGAAGSAVVPIVFTNTGSTPCTLYGYPGVSFLDGSGKQLGVPATRNGGDEGVVTLAPNGTANSQLQLPDPGNFPAAGCKEKTSARLLVYPPGETSTLSITDVAQVCTTPGGATSVTPVTPGSGG
jgi:hypothetical protein